MEFVYVHVVSLLLDDDRRIFQGCWRCTKPLLAERVIHVAYCAQLSLALLRAEHRVLFDKVKVDHQNGMLITLKPVAALSLLHDPEKCADIASGRYVEIPFSAMTKGD